MTQRNIRLSNLPADPETRIWRLEGRMIAFQIKSESAIKEQDTEKENSFWRALSIAMEQSDRAVLDLRATGRI